VRNKKLKITIRTVGAGASRFYAPWDLLTTASTLKLAGFGFLESNSTLSPVIKDRQGIEEEVKSAFRLRFYSNSEKTEWLELFQIAFNTIYSSGRNQLLRAIRLLNSAMMAVSPGFFLYGQFSHLLSTVTNVEER